MSFVYEDSDEVFLNSKSILRGRWIGEGKKSLPRSNAGKINVGYYDCVPTSSVNTSEKYEEYVYDEVENYMMMKYDMMKYDEASNT